MRLLQLRLQNFRQHAATEIEFRPGLTGIIGPNGAGKSTILEAIAWAIYGSDATRGTNETLRFSRAAPRARVEVELRFALDGHEYRALRTLGQAEVYADGAAQPAATSAGGVTRYLQARLGMSRREFFNTYFSGQKELQFLAAMGPAERGRFLSQVLGYERLRQAQELARARRSELRHALAALRTAMPDPERLAQQRADAEAALAGAEQAFAAAEAEHTAAAQSLAGLTPRWAAAQETRERRHALAAQLRELAAELARVDERLARVERAPELAERYATDLAGLRGELHTAQVRRDELRAAWLRDRQDAETKLQGYRDRGHELKLQIQQIRSAGPDGRCPTCERPLGGHFERLLAELDEQWLAIVQDGKWWKSRVEQLHDEPHELVEQGSAVAALDASVDEAARRLARCERAVVELEALRADRAAYAARHDEATRQLPGAAAAEDDPYDALRAEVERAATAAHRAELRATELRGQRDGAAQALATLRSYEQEHHRRADEVRALDGELRHHNELDAALEALRAELNACVRPELAALASRFLAQLTDGRYAALEIDENYDLLLLDEGERKPVISGGEEDVANLVLRLALSQMIAERAGHRLSLLVLDEVFGSLDVAHRDNVVQLLRRLEDRFEQVVLITHLDALSESLDRTIQVEYDERSGASVVRC